MSCLQAYIDLALDMGISSLIESAERRTLSFHCPEQRGWAKLVHHDIAHHSLADIQKIQEVLEHCTSDECSLSQDQVTQILGLQPDVSELRNRIYLCRVSAERYIKESRY